MATKKPVKKAEVKPASKKDPEKEAKRKARMEAIKNRPAGQRPNSKQCDVIELANGTKVKTFAMPVRKFGVVLTTVAEDAKGNVVSTGITTLPGFSVRVKKGHGILKAGVPGMGKGKNMDEDEVEDQDEDEQDED